jgi:hypothetical protein
LPGDPLRVPVLDVLLAVAGQIDRPVLVGLDALDLDLRRFAAAVGFAARQQHLALEDLAGGRVELGKVALVDASAHVVGARAN